MNLREYFENAQGRGVLATSDAQGVVDVAVYARPHFVEEDICVFLMADRLTHKNVQDNPHAAYLFMEQSDKYLGKRLYLTKTEESEDQEMIDKLRRRKRSSCICGNDTNERTFVVYFHVDSIRPLIGDN